MLDAEQRLERKSSSRQIQTRKATDIGENENGNYEGMSTFQQWCPALYVENSLIAPPVVDLG